jgi:glycosyltransferase involved in cell wall biosynthesis
MKPPSGAPVRVVMLLSNERVAHDPRVLTEARLAVQGGHAVTVLCWDRSDGAAPRRELDGIQLVFLHARSTFEGGLSQLFSYLRFCGKACFWLLRQECDVIHCHDLDTLIIGWIAGIVRRKPVVFDAHEAYPEMQRARSRVLYRVTTVLERFLARRADAIVTVGERMKQRFERLTNGRVPVHYIGSWKDPADFRFSPERLAETRRQIASGEERLLVGYFGSLYRSKPILPLLEAAERVGGIRLVIAGAGEQEGIVREWAQRCAWVRYLGVIPHADVCRYTAASDVMYYGFDPTWDDAIYTAGNNLFNAIAAGKPLLSVDCGELADIVRALGCGYLMPTLDAAECERGLRYWLEAANRENAMRASQAGAAVYCTGEIQRRLAALYRELCGEARQELTAAQAGGANR